jgi:hypothetical protein
MRARQLGNGASAAPSKRGGFDETSSPDCGRRRRYLDRRGDRLAFRFGGYTNVIPILVDDPPVKAIVGAVFKPAGAGPTTIGSGDI